MNNNESQLSEETINENTAAIDLFNKLCSFHREINTLSEDVKTLMQESKEKGLDVVLINNLAKGYVKDKIGEIEERAELTLTMISNLIPA